MRHHAQLAQLRGRKGGAGERRPVGGAAGEGGIGDSRRDWAVPTRGGGSGRSLEDGGGAWARLQDRGRTVEASLPRRWLELLGPGICSPARPSQRGPGAAGPRAALTHLLSSPCRRQRLFSEGAGGGAAGFAEPQVKGACRQCWPWLRPSGHVTADSIGAGQRSDAGSHREERGASARARRLPSYLAWRVAADRGRWHRLETQSAQRCGCIPHPGGRAPARASNVRKNTE
ncbi:uncharacterized protein LOC134476312 [Cavia porcellus]|uniref:uncharacterized protein LOC134476312 n=1 Tax=Cavia porcellus TaxID=10141 RepID=UPI002FE2F474